MLAVASALPPGLDKIRSSSGPWQPAADFHHGLHVLEGYPGAGRATSHPLRLVDDQGALRVCRELYEVFPTNAVEIRRCPGLRNRRVNLFEDLAPTRHARRNSLLTRVGAGAVARPGDGRSGRLGKVPADRLVDRHRFGNPWPRTSLGQKTISFSCPGGGRVLAGLHVAHNNLLRPPDGRS